MIVLTGTGVEFLRTNGTPSMNDLVIKRDGQRYVVYHYARQGAIAVYTGEGKSADAYKELKMLLITRRLKA